MVVAGRPIRVRQIPGIFPSNPKGDMLLLIALVLALLLGCLSSYGSRWQATSLWAGKALAPPESASAMPRGIQDALMQGPESWLGLVVPLLAVGTGVAAFWIAWWASLLVWFIYGLSWTLADRTFVPRTVDWYLLRLHNALANRAADYEKNNDALRADAALSIRESLWELYQIYQGSSILAPSMERARAAPLGEDYDLFADPDTKH